MTTSPMQPVSESHLIGGSLAALTVMRALSDGALNRAGYEATVNADNPRVRAALDLTRDLLSVADLHTEVVPILLALGRTAVAGLSVTQGGTREAVQRWLGIQRKAIMDAERAAATEYGPDRVVMNVALILSQEMPGDAPASTAECTDRVTRAVRT